MNMIDDMRVNIPKELTELKQWVVSGIDKAPRNPLTGNFASVTNPNTWGTYKEAIDAGWKNIGFVLTESDPYTIVDLDDKLTDPATDKDKKQFAQIVKDFDSYTELSQSERGAHIVCKGNVIGCRSGRFEIYSKERYMIFTGNVHGKPLAIANRQEQAESLAKFIGGDSSPAPVSTGRKFDRSIWGNPDPVSTMPNGAPVVDPPTLSDDEVIRKCWEAGGDSGAKFQTLWAGGKLAHNPSQSEGDTSFTNLLAFHSTCRDQLRRIFKRSERPNRQSMIGREDKIEKAIDFALNSPKVFNHWGIQGGPPIPFNPTLQNPSFPDADLVRVKEAEKPQGELIFPPGLVGMIAQEIMDNSHSKVPEYCLGAAIGMMAGICGRSYNVSTTGLNQYIMVLGETATGKETVSSGPGRIMSAVVDKIPEACLFIGSGNYASAQALETLIGERKVCYCTLSEIGKKLAAITYEGKGEDRNKTAQKIPMLELYNKTGHTDTVYPAAYANKDNNAPPIKSPNLTILGEGTTDSFYDAISPDNITDGLIPRFLIIQFDGQVPWSKRSLIRRPINPYVLEGVMFLAKRALKDFETRSRPNDSVLDGSEYMVTPGTTDVRFTKDAEDIKNSHDKHFYKLRQKNDELGLSEAERGIYGRTHIKMIKTAALVAVGVDAENPIITEEILDWSISFIERCDAGLLKKLKSGELSSGIHMLENEVVRCFNKYLTISAQSANRNYKVSKALSTKDHKYVPHTYLFQWCRKQSSFKNSGRIISETLKSITDSLIESKVIELVDPLWCKNNLECTCAVYQRGKHFPTS